MTNPVRGDRVVARAPRMTLEEASAIARHAREGVFDTGDPAVRTMVEQANQTVTRAELSGTVADGRQPSRRRPVIIVAVLATGVWIAGFVGAMIGAAVR